MQVIFFSGRKGTMMKEIIEHAIIDVTCHEIVDMVLSDSHLANWVGIKNAPFKVMVRIKNSDHGFEQIELDPESPVVIHVGEGCS